MSNQQFDEHHEYLRRRTDRERDDGDLILAALFGLLWLLALVYVAWRAASAQ